MDICFVDESGSAQLLDSGVPDSPPAMVLVGLIVPEGHHRQLLWDYLQLKKKFNPSLGAPGMRLSNLISTEMKGAELRKDLRGSKRIRGRSLAISGSVLSLLERHQCRLVAETLVKKVAAPVDDGRVYSGSIAWICRTFHRYLESRNKEGIVVVDSRTKVKNTINADVITTQMFKHGGDAFPRLAEVPVYGHSDSHVCLQMADVLASSLLFPSITSAFCSGHSWNVHCDSRYDVIRDRFGSRLKSLQFRYQDAATGYWMGGVHIRGLDPGVPPTTVFQPATSATPPLPGLSV